MAAPASDLAKTMQFDPYIGLIDLERHMARLRADAAEAGFAFDHHACRNELQAATFRHTTARHVRLRLSPRGSVAIEVSAPGGDPATRATHPVARTEPTGL